MSKKQSYSKLIKEEATRIGFTSCGISKAEFLEKDALKLEQWLKLGLNGKMAYMENHFDKRLDPRLLVDGAKSVISLTFNYYTNISQEDVLSPKISKYALGQDYHKVIKDKLQGLLFFIRENIGEVNGRVFTDSAPILERSWAAKSGSGWIGKNSCLITKNHGSFFFLAELIIDLDLEYDQAILNYCGSCNKCIETCPTKAIIAPGVIDSNKCISYLTIEYRDNIPSEMKNIFENWMFGCDICQDVCPWNRFSKPHNEPKFEANPEVLMMLKKGWIELTEETFNKIFKNSAVKRTKFSGLKRNIDFLVS